jgi:hypothetical protein
MRKRGIAHYGACAVGHSQLLRTGSRIRARRRNLACARHHRHQQGRIIAALEDYAVVRELVANLVAEGVEATIKPEIREIVEASARLIVDGRQEVRQADLKAVLNLDKSAISRRVAGALNGGFLKNLEDRKGRPARLVLPSR